MEERVVVMDQETGEKFEMSRLAFENLVFYDNLGRYREIQYELA